MSGTEKIVTRMSQREIVMLLMRGATVHYLMGVIRADWALIWLHGKLMGTIDGRRLGEIESARLVHLTGVSQKGCSVYQMTAMVRADVERVIRGGGGGAQYGL